MSDTRSIFYDEWRACLHAHYLHVIRTGDVVTEPTLRHVLVQAGLNPEEVTTLQTDTLIETEVEPVEAAAFAEDVVSEEEVLDEPLTIDAGDTDDSEAEESPPDSPAQLSLF